jgi:LacI family transcriptional regulator
MSTLADVAERANVSITTVSRVLRRDPSLAVPPETAERIWQAAKDLQYKIKSKSSVSRRPTRIGVIRFMTSEDDEVQNPYFSEIREGIVQECARHQISVHLFADADPQLIELDGVMVIGDNPQFRKDYGTKLEHVAFVDNCPDLDRYDSVIVNYAQSTWAMLDHLRQKYDRIGFIGGMGYLDAQGNRQMDARRVAFEQYMKAAKIYEPQHVRVEGWTPESGYAMMSAAISQPKRPNAFFAASDRLAFGAMKAVRDAGLSIPEEIAVTGFDDIEIAHYAHPALTTIQTNPRQMGAMAVKLLMDRLEGWDIPRQVVLTGRLIVRESCGIAPRSDGQSSPRNSSSTTDPVVQPSLS